MGVNTYKMNTSLQILERAVPLGSIEAYTHWVNQIPMLTKEEEYDLAVRFHKNNDLAAAQSLVLAHLRFVVHVARNYVSYGLQMADLIQEGSIGLMKAVKRFDPKLGVRLVSFAVHWIKAEIHEFVLRNWRIVRMATTKAQRKLFFNLRKMTKKLGRLGWLSEDEINIVAKELNVKPQDVVSMEMRLNNQDVSFDGFTDDEEESRGQNPVHYLEDQSLSSANPAQQLENSNWEFTQEQGLGEALSVLDARSLDILQQRWLNAKKSTLQELAVKYNVSAERIRQIEENALLKLRKELRKF